MLSGLPRKATPRAGGPYEAHPAAHTCASVNLACTNQLAQYVNPIALQPADDGIRKHKGIQASRTAGPVLPQGPRDESREPPLVRGGQKVGGPAAVAATAVRGCLQVDKANLQAGQTRIRGRSAAAVENAAAVAFR